MAAAMALGSFPPITISRPVLSRPRRPRVRPEKRPESLGGEGGKRERD